MKILIVDTFYGPYLEKLYASGDLIQQPWLDQHKAHFAGGFGTGDAYSHGLGLLGVEAIEIVANSMPLQRSWAQDHRPDLLQLQDPRQLLLAILEAQIRWFQPTIFYVQDINWLPAGFIQHVKPLVELVVGQNACPLTPELDLSPYDLLLTSLPHYVARFRTMGVKSEYFPIGFDDRLLKRHRTDAPRSHVLTFVGGLGGYHSKGTQMLEVVAHALPLQVWGYGGQQLPIGSILRERWHGEAWAHDMYGLLSKSQITINRHIDIAAEYANNMRLYEATGMGACLLTDHKSNISTLFEVDREIITFKSQDEAISKAKELISKPSMAKEIALLGQARTLKDHTYGIRMERLIELLHKYCKSAQFNILSGVMSSANEKIYVPVCVSSQNFDAARSWAKRIKQRRKDVEFTFFVDQVNNSCSEKIWTVDLSSDCNLAAGAFFDCVKCSGIAITYGSRMSAHCDGMYQAFKSSALKRHLILKQVA